MAQPIAVKVKGYRECVRALQRVDKDTKKEMLGALKASAEPVAKDARSLLSRYQGASINTINPRAVTSGVYVTQRARKKTGKRPDFGSLQMRVGLIPALDKHEDDIVESVDHAIGILTNREGF